MDIFRLTSEKLNRSYPSRILISFVQEHGQLVYNTNYCCIIQQQQQQQQQNNNNNNNNNADKKLKRNKLCE